MTNILVPDNVAKQVSQVNSILPTFVIEDHGKFVEFLKAYYRWSASQGPAAAMNYMKLNNDIDFVIDSLLDGYANLFAHNIPRDMKADYRFFIKFLKDFYQNKGSEESYKILYRALFNEEVLVYFPKRNMFITSAAEWAKDSTFRIDYSGDGYSIRGKILKGEENGFTCMVSDVIRVNGSWVIYYQNSTGNFTPNEKLEIVGNNEYANVVPMYSIKSIDSKSNWHDNDIIILDDDLIIQVDKIYYGYINNITITNGGTGWKVGDLITTESDYSGTGFQAKVTSVDSSGTVTACSIKRTGFGYTNENVRFIAQTGLGSGFTANITWNQDFRKIQAASIILNKKKLVSGDLIHHFGDNETIVFSDGAYTKPKNWKVIKGATSTETARITDSYYYQEYSYVLSSIANTAGYEESLKKVLQIAGLKLFIEQTVSEKKNLKTGSRLLVS